jgi:hypothetical protein
MSREFLSEKLKRRDLLGGIDMGGEIILTYLLHGAGYCLKS